MESLNLLFAQYGAFVRSNQVIAGAVSLWGLGVLTWACRKIPAAVWGFLVGQLTTSLSFNNSQYGYARDNFVSFLTWYQKHTWVRFSRSFSLEAKAWGSMGDSPMELGIGNGRHFFFYKHRLFVVRHHTEQKAGSDNIIHGITIRMLGRNHEILRQLVDAFSYKFPKGASGIYSFRGREWNLYTGVTLRELRTVVVNRQIKEKIVKDIADFLVSEQWYRERGLAHKKTFVIHGIPGTGKTSLIKAIAQHFGMNICILNMNDMSDEKFSEALATMPKRSILAIEDFDSAKATHARNTLAKKEKKESDNDEDEGEVSEAGGIFDDLNNLTLSGILNALDGIVQLDGRLIFLTTNVLEDIDPALLRKGRVDYIYELGPLVHEEVVEYIRLMFPDHPIPDHLFMSILGCDIQALYFEHRDNFDDFIKALPKEEHFLQLLGESAVKFSTRR